MLAHLLAAAQRPDTVQLMREGWAALARLPFRHIVCLDTEFRTGGEKHRGWSLCGVELREGRPIKVWLDGRSEPAPFSLDHNTLFVAFVAGAEVATIRVLGWPMPERIFDLFQEFRLVSNTGQKSDPRGLEAACAHYGIATFDHDAKKHMQTEAQARTLWNLEQQRPLVDYCYEDGLATARLFLCVWAHWLRIHAGDEEPQLHHALRRGLYAGILAEAELLGIPFRMAEWEVLRDGRDRVFDAMVDALAPALRPIYRPSAEGPVQDHAVFAETMDRLGLAEDWPRTATGLLKTDKHVLSDMLQIPTHLEARAQPLGVTTENLQYLGEVMQIR
jgi:hypothetical protein